MRPAALRLAAFAALADAVAARCEGLEEWLYESPDWAPPGYHVLCAERGPGSTSFELFRGGHSGRKVQWDSKISSMSSLRKQLEKKAHMEWQNMWKVLPWLLADTSGVPVQDPSAVQGLLLLFEGGRWVWPGIRENFQRRVALPLPKGQMNVTLKTLTLDPLSFTIEDLFDKASAERMIQLAKPKLRPAEILTQDSQKENAEDLGVEVRTCCRLRMAQTWKTWPSAVRRWCGCRGSYRRIFACCGMKPDSTLGHIPTTTSQKTFRSSLRCSMNCKMVATGWSQSICT